MLALLLGVGSGLLTTITGVGGGMMLLLALALLYDPWMALALTAPALFIGNGQRAWMFRRSIDRRVAGAIAIGALPGAIVGGMLVVGLPAWLLHGAMAALTALAVARALGVSLPAPRTAALTPFGFFVGMIVAGGGGSGVLVAPMLMSLGLSGERYVATAATCGVVMHLGRLSGYGASGMFSLEHLPFALALAAAITVGNLLGRSVRTRLEKRTTKRLEVGALVVASAMALMGVAP